MSRSLASVHLNTFLPIWTYFSFTFAQLGASTLIDDGLDIGTQLEFGISSRTLLSLMELGLSRMSAVALYEKIAHDDLNQQGCVAWVTERASQFEGMGIPVLIINEIRDKLLRTGA